MTVPHVISAFTAAHPDSLLQTTYEGTGFGEETPVMDEYMRRADSLRAATLEGGVTQPATSRDIAEGVPNLEVGKDEWYGVGGAPDYRTVPPGEEAPHYKELPRVPETVISAQQFGVHHALTHILSVEGHNIVRGRQPLSKAIPAVYAGGWTRGDDAVLDHSLSLPHMGTALRMARDVGEDAVFDAKKIQDIDPYTGKPIP